MLAPIVVLTTVVVFASGVALLFVGPSSRDTLLPIHKVSFIVWLAFTALHVLGHLLELPATLRADYAPAAAAHRRCRPVAPGARSRSPARSSPAWCSRSS